MNISHCCSLVHWQVSREPFQLISDYWLQNRFSNLIGYLQKQQNYSYRHLYSSRANDIVRRRDSSFPIGRCYPKIMRLLLTSQIKLMRAMIAIYVKYRLVADAGWLESSIRVEKFYEMLTLRSTRSIILLRGKNASIVVIRDRGFLLLPSLELKMRFILETISFCSDALYARS